MKKILAAALILSMLLCGCGKEKGSSESKGSDTQPTTAASEQKETTTAETADHTETTSANVTTTAEAAETTAGTAEETPEETQTGTVSLNNDPFEGLYVEEVAHNGTLSVDRQGNIYKVHIGFKDSAAVYHDWYFTGEFDGRQVLRYNNCLKSTVTYSEDGSADSVQDYTDGTGYIRISEEGTKTGLIWVDDKEDAGSGVFFVKQ